MKTILNIYTQGTRHHLSRFVSVDIGQLLVETICRGTRGSSTRSSTRSSARSSARSSSSHEGGANATALHAMAQLVHHQHAGTFDCKEVLLRCLTVDLLPTIMEGLADTRSKSLPSLLDVVNYVLLQSAGMRRLAEGDHQVSSRHHHPVFANNIS